MKTQIKSILTIFIAAVLFTSCSDDDDAVIDTEKPQIAIIEPHDEDEFAPGSELHFEATFTDNVELASYKIEIHDDLDGHTHAINKSSHDLNPWSWEDTFTIPAGRTSFDAVHHIDIPAEIDGNPISEGVYHVGVFVTDASGNQQEHFIQIHIEANAEEHTH